MNTVQTTLVGRFVNLEPLEQSHVDALFEVGADPALWALTVTVVRTRDEMQSYIEGALAARDAGTAFPFVTVSRADNRIVGSTRLMNFDRTNSRVEIGSTWIAAPWQRTAVNTEAKLLMLEQAFEVMNLERVELKTDALNIRSRNAIARLGAVEEGILRRHMLTWDGRMRDTVYFSILRDEWPSVRARLEEKLRA